MIALGTGSFALPVVDSALELVPHAVNGLRGETQLLPLQRPRLEKLVEKHAPITFAIAVTRDESCDVTGIFDRDLHELAFLAKAVHAGIAFGRRLRGGLRSQNGSNQQDQAAYSRKSHPHYYSTDHPTQGSRRFKAGIGWVFQIFENTGRPGRTDIIGSSPTT